MSSRFPLLPLAACLAAAAVAPLSAQQPEIRVITQTEATSECIGDPKPPLCAVETFNACGTRRQVELCRLIGRDGFYNAGPPSWPEYFQISQHLIREEEIPEHLKDTDWYRPGYVFLDLKKRSRYADGKVWPADGWATYSYTLKPVGDKWHVVSSVLAGHEDFIE